jgi:hypothetical protein
LKRNDIWKLLLPREKIVNGRQTLPARKNKMKNNFTKVLNPIIIGGVLLTASGCQTMSNLSGKTKSGNNNQANYATSDKTKTGGGLADKIIGTWEIEGKDKTRFTFGKDGSLIVKQQEEAAPQNATYSVLDADAIEVRMEGKPKLVIIIKIAGDTMRMNTQNRGNETLKRIN